MVISQVFTAPVPGGFAPRATLLELLKAGAAAKMAVLDDPGLTGTGWSSAGVLGLRAADMAERLTADLVQEIVIRGSRGGALAPSSMRSGGMAAERSWPMAEPDSRSH
jgi:hypothetical protein